ncbi:MAG: Ldh family oxidoreductase [Armatimonadetes bacterium]|nr:Ldh family oxidoreductase [Armatimonadota bacterium]
MPVLRPEELERIAVGTFVAAGIPADEARIIGRSLVVANLAGHDSHGVIRVAQYLNAIEKGEVVPGAPFEVLRESPASAVVDAHWGFGQVAATRAAELAIAKAEKCSVAGVAVRCSYHVGRLSDYVELAAARGMVGLMFLNSHGAAHRATPWGGAQGRLSTNPIACALPTGADPIVVDITTSAVAEGKVRVHHNARKPVPDGWLIDAEGSPTNDPAALYATPPGAILPLGGNLGYKGFGLSLMVDLLAGALSDAGCSGCANARIGNAFLILVLDLRAFCGPAEFAAHADGLLAWVKSARLAPGAAEILAPGEIERRETRRRQQEGILVDDGTWGQLREAAARAGFQPQQHGWEAANARE